MRTTAILRGVTNNVARVSLEVPSYEHNGIKGTASRLFRYNRTTGELSAREWRFVPLHGTMGVDAIPLHRPMVLLSAEQQNMTPQVMRLLQGTSTSAIIWNTGTLDPTASASLVYDRDKGAEYRITQHISTNNLFQRIENEEGNHPKEFLVGSVPEVHIFRNAEHANYVHFPSREAVEESMRSFRPSLSLNDLPTYLRDEADALRARVGAHWVEETWRRRVRPIASRETYWERQDAAFKIITDLMCDGAQRRKSLRKAVPDVGRVNWYACRKEPNIEYTHDHELTDTQKEELAEAVRAHLKDAAWEIRELVINSVTTFSHALVATQREPDADNGDKVYRTIILIDPVMGVAASRRTRVSRRTGEVMARSAWLSHGLEETAENSGEYVKKPANQSAWSAPTSYAMHRAVIVQEVEAEIALSREVLGGFEVDSRTTEELATEFAQKAHVKLDTDARAFIDSLREDGDSAQQPETMPLKESNAVLSKIREQIRFNQGLDQFDITPEELPQIAQLHQAANVREITADELEQLPLHPFAVLPIHLVEPSMEVDYLTDRSYERALLCGAIGSLAYGTRKPTVPIIIPPRGVLLRMSGWYRFHFAGGRDSRVVRFYVGTSRIQSVLLEYREEPMPINGRITMQEFWPWRVERIEKIDATQVPAQMLRRWHYICARQHPHYRPERIRELSLRAADQGLGRSPRVARPMHTHFSWRGMQVFRSRYMATIATFKRAGEIITRNDRSAAQDLVDLLAFASNPHGADELIVNAYQRFTGDTSLVVADCTHVSNEVIETAQDGNVCADCYDEDFIVPEDADVAYRLDDLHQHSDGYYYTFPEEDDDDEWDDDDDDDDDGRCGENRYVKAWNANVLGYCSMDTTIDSTPYGNFLMGIELEVETKSTSQYLSATRTTFEDFDGYAILKTDSSLDSGGFEIVTAPRGLDEHIKRLGEWKPHESLISWDAGTCGTHVHISSKAFTSITLGKFIEFINADYNDDFIYSIAGRHPSRDRSAGRYTQREPVRRRGNPKRLLEDKGSSRYVMVNTTNLSRQEMRRLGISTNDSGSSNTVELRIFKGTLNKKRLLAQIEFTHAAVMFCRATSMRALTEEHFINWLRGMAGMYPNLARWFGVKTNTKAVEAQPKAREDAEI